MLITQNYHGVGGLPALAHLICLFGSFEIGTSMHEGSSMTGFELFFAPTFGIHKNPINEPLAILDVRISE